ncbi:MAG TPA: transglutaminase domain-containing protein [Micromonosporaceae bacterium]|nr:transglutaminase domain-containing protein [Micromonosporaceae bacterium]
MPANTLPDYVRQTRYSDPGAHAKLLAALPPNVADISAAVRNVLVHYRAAGYPFTGGRLAEIDCRWVSRILDVDQARHGTPLTGPRVEEQRVAGCCRDFTLLTVAGLRHHGIPARSRIGFAGYFVPGWHHDHVVVELLGDGRFVDAQLDPASWPFDTGNVPRGIDAFATAAEVWTAHRRGEIDVSTFGVDPSLPFRGETFVRNYVLMELAHRHGDEMLLWDDWGHMRGPGEAPSDPEFIDELAALLIAADAGDTSAEEDLAHRYGADERLRPGARVVSHSPTGTDLLVDLEARTSTPA